MIPYPGEAALAQSDGSDHGTNGAQAHGLLGLGGVRPDGADHGG
jgi:hypothetical protein